MVSPGNNKFTLRLTAQQAQSMKNTARRYNCIIYFQVLCSYVSDGIKQERKIYTHIVHAIE